MSANPAFSGTWNQDAFGGELGAPTRRMPRTNVIEEERDASNLAWHTPKVANTPIILRVSFRAPKPKWLNGVADRFSHLAKLPANWDSYGARPVTVKAIESALGLLGEVMYDDLPLPDIIPAASGGIQCEWHIAGIDLELEVSAEGKRAAFFEDSHGQYPTTEDEGRIADLVEILRTRLNEPHR